MATKPITTTITEELYHKAKKYNIPISFALHKGLIMLLSERGDNDFLNERNVNLIVKDKEEEIARLKRAINHYVNLSDQKKEKGEKKEN